MITAAICDDHAVVRKGLIDILNHESNIKIVGEASNLDSSYLICKEKKPDLLLLDLNLDNSNGIDTIVKIKTFCPHTKLLIFSMRESITTIRAAYELGIDGYVTKSSGPEVLVRAIHTIHQGNIFYMDGYQARVERPEDDPRVLLVDKDLEIFKLLAEGKSRPDIAKEMNMTPKTVANRIPLFMKKLGIKPSGIEYLARKYGIINNE